MNSDQQPSQRIPEIRGKLRHRIVEIPRVVEQVRGIRIFGQLIRSLIFTTDVAIERNCNADAIIAVYPFTPQPIINQAIIMAASRPVFSGVGGGTTTGQRVVELAVDAEFRGAMGIVLNAPTINETIALIAARVDIPVVVTVVREDTDTDARLKAGTSIFNVSGAARTPEIVRAIRKRHGSDVPIIATGGPTEESILRTMEAGADAITYTPPTSAELFKELMTKYRE